MIGDKGLGVLQLLLHGRLDLELLGAAFVDGVDDAHDHLIQRRRHVQIERADLGLELARRWRFFAGR